MRSFFASLLQLAIPSTAGPNQPRIVITGALPPPLDTYTFGGSSYRGGIIFYGEGDDTTYVYLCAVRNVSVATPGIKVHVGQVRSGAVVESVAGQPQVQEWAYNTLTSSVWYRHNPGQLDLFSGDLADQYGVQVAGAATSLRGIAVSILAPLVGSGQLIVDTDFVQWPRLIQWFRGSTGGTGIGALHYDSQRIPSTGTTATTVAFALIAGCTTTVAVLGPNDIIDVRGHFDVVAAVIPTSVWNGTLFVDGVAQSGNATYRSSAAGERATVSQEWRVTGLSVGNHTFELRHFSSVAAQFATQITNTVMIIDPKHCGG